jgi:hypothetical protein
VVQPGYLVEPGQRTRIAWVTGSASGDPGSSLRPATSTRFGRFAILGLIRGDQLLVRWVIASVPPPGARTHHRGDVATHAGRARGAWRAASDAVINAVSGLSGHHGPHQRAGRPGCRRVGGRARAAGGCGAAWPAHPPGRHLSARRRPDRPARAGPGRNSQHPAVVEYRARLVLANAAVRRASACKWA